MRAVSDRYADHLFRDHERVVRVDVLGIDGTLKASTHEEGDLPLLSVVGGQVRVSRSTRIRRGLTLEIAGDNADVVPGAVGDLFSTVSGNRIKPYVGMRFPDGTEEVFSQGVFDIRSVEIDDRPDSFVVRIEGYDGTRKVIREPFESTYTIAATNNVQQEAAWLVTGVDNATEFRATPSSHLTPQMTFEEGTSKADAVDKLLFSIGYEWFFDAEGVCVMQPVPDVFDLGPGTYTQYFEGVHVTEVDGQTITSEGTILGLNASSDNEEVHNRVVIIGESTSLATPVRGEAIDSDPASFTYYYGPYGRITKTIRTPTVTTAAQAADAALGELRRSKLPTRTIRMDAITNPAHEETDGILIVRLRSKIIDIFVIDGMVIPFGADQPMMLTTCPRPFA